MKIIVVLSLLLCALQSFGFASYFSQRPDMVLVLGLNKQAASFSSPFEFPCTNIAGRVYCDNSGVRFNNEQCAKTFFVDRIADKMEIGCMIGLRTIVLGVTLSQARVNLPSSNYDFYPVRFAKSVSIKPSTKRGYIYDIHTEVKR